MAPPDGNLPTKLGGIQITVDGRPAPIFAVTPAPFPGLPAAWTSSSPTASSAEGRTVRVPLRVSKDGAGEHPAVRLSLREATPGIFVHNFGEAREKISSTPRPHWPATRTGR